jgi:hypothetical protein
MSQTPPFIHIDQIEIEGVKTIPKNTVYVSNNAKMEVELKFSDPHSQIGKDAWLGFYAQGSKDNNYISFVKCESGKMCYLISLPRKPGLYQVRYFPSKEYSATSLSKIVRSGPILSFKAHIDQTDPTKIDVTWNQIFGLVDIASGYIGVFNEESVLDNYINIDRSEGKIQLKTPLASGTYTVRLILVAASLPTIQGVDSIHVEFKNGGIVAKLKILSFDPFWGLSWIGLFKAGEKDPSKYLSYRIIRSIEGEFVFPLENIVETSFEIKMYPKFASTVPTLVAKISK